MCIKVKIFLAVVRYNRTCSRPRPKLTETMTEREIAGVVLGVTGMLLCFPFKSPILGVGVIILASLIYIGKI